MTPAVRSDRILFWWLAAAGIANFIAVGLHWLNEAGPHRTWASVVAFTLQVPALIIIFAVLIVLVRRRHARRQRFGTKDLRE